METRPYQHLYGRRWRKRRKLFLRSNPLCVMCSAKGRLAAATVADHIIPHKGDPELFRGELQALCQPCHDQDKKRIEQGQNRDNQPLFGIDGFRIEKPASERSYTPAGLDITRPSNLKPALCPLTIVCGPPGSGKTTYINQHREPHEPLICLDTIIAELGGATGALSRGRLVKPALMERNKRLAELSRAPSPTRTWFIVGAPTRTERQWWSDTLRAERVLVLQPTMDECIRRVRQDPARADRLAQIEGAIHTWFERWQPWAKCDEVITNINPSLRVRSTYST
jgi:hypothetical protein